MTIKQAFDMLRMFLVRELSGKLQHNNWIEFRGDRFCQECRNHRRSALYMYVAEDSALFLKCFRASCSLKRAVTAQDLVDLGFKNQEAIKLLLSTCNLNKLEFKNIEYSVNDLIITTTRFSVKQEDYFYKRCRFVPTKVDMDFYHLIPNFRQLVYDNFISLDGVKNKYKDFLEKYEKHFPEYNKTEYITYFTNDGNKFLYRSIDDTSKSIPKGQISIEPNKKSLYHVSKTDNPEDLVICEGIFDLINISKTFHKNSDNSVFTSTGGIAAFEKHIIELHKKYSNSIKNLYIYADSDIYVEEYKRYDLDINAISIILRKVFKKIPIIMFEKVYIIYNTKYKDVGDMDKPIRLCTNVVNPSSVDNYFKPLELIRI